MKVPAGVSVLGREDVAGPAGDPDVLGETRPSPYPVRPVKLQVYVLRQLAVALAFSVGGVLAISLPGIAVSAVHRLPNAEAIVLLRFVPLTLQTIAPYVLPICFLLAVVATYGRLAADREWTAIQMAGIYPPKLLLPPVGVALLLGLATYWMVATQLPLLKTRLRQIQVDAVTSSIENLGPGRTSLKVDEFLLEAQWQDPETGTLHEVYVREPESDGRPRRDYHASTANMRIVDGVLTATMTDLYVVQAGGDVAQQYHEWFEFDYAFETEPREPSLRPRYYTSSELRSMLASGTVEPDLVSSYRFELQYRLVLCSAYLLFVGLGVPTGLILRRGTQLGALAVSSGYGLLYYVLNMRLAKGLGIEGLVPPVLGAWTPTAIGAVAALPLLRRAMRR